jgi:hypothetical protein
MEVVKLSLCFSFTEHHAIKTYWGWRYSSTHSLTSAIDGGEWSASRPSRFTPRKRASDPLDRRLGGPQSQSERGSEEKNSQPLPALEPPIIQPVAQRYTTELSRFLLLKWILQKYDIWRYGLGDEMDGEYSTQQGWNVEGYSSDLYLWP